MSDPLWMTGKPFPVTLAGREWKATPLTFSGRDAVNAALREAYPHPFAEAKEQIRDLDPEKDKDVRNFILETYRDRLNLAGWPLTLDTLEGRAMAIGHDKPRSILALEALGPNHADLDLDRARELLARSSWAEVIGLFGVALEVRPADPGEKPSEDQADPKDSGASTGEPSATPA